MDSEPGIMAHTLNHSSQEAEAGEQSARYNNAQSQKI